MAKRILNFIIETLQVVIVMRAKCYVRGDVTDSPSEDTSKPEVQKGHAMPAQYLADGIPVSCSWYS